MLEDKMENKFAEELNLERGGRVSLLVNLAQTPAKAFSRHLNETCYTKLPMTCMSTWHKLL